MRQKVSPSIHFYVPHIFSGCACFGLRPETFPTNLIRHSHILLFLMHVYSVTDIMPNENFCTTYELNLLQSGIGQNLTTHNFLSSIVNGLATNFPLQKSLACTTCAEGAYAIVRPQLGKSTEQKVDGFFNRTCGSSFQGQGEPLGCVFPDVIYSFSHFLLVAYGITI
jgi:hypothetical protein